jgi:hypothetical protein
LEIVHSRGTVGFDLTKTRKEFSLQETEIVGFSDGEPV